MLSFKLQTAVTSKGVGGALVASRLKLNYKHPVELGANAPFYFF
jgi:hypothetical protein